MELIQAVVALVFFFIFIAFSVYAIIFWLTTPYNIISTKHWTLKAYWFWGGGFLGLIITATLISFIVYLASVMLGAL